MPEKRTVASMLGEPKSELFRLTRKGTRALLDAVDHEDERGAREKASKSKPCEAVNAYLHASFIGRFLQAEHECGFMGNAGVVSTYIAFLDHELERGDFHAATPMHQIYLKLLAYVTTIEASVPLTLFGNCLEFLDGNREPFNFGIYYDLPSAFKKLDAVDAAVKRVGAEHLPDAFHDLHERLQQLIDPTLRNAIAHATYRVHTDTDQVEVWKKGQQAKTYSFAEIDALFQDAQDYRTGFVRGVEDFAEGIHPDCPYYWQPSH